MIKIYAIMFIITVGCGIAGSAYFLWNDMQKKVEVLTEENQALESAVTLQNETIISLEGNIQSVNRELRQAYDSLETARRNTEKLEAKLEDRDLGLLAERKPRLVEGVVNNATDKALRCFELLSGAELNENERNAKNGTEFNSECPWLFDTIRTP